MPACDECPAPLVLNPDGNSASSAGHGSSVAPAKTSDDDDDVKEHRKKRPSTWDKHTQKRPGAAEKDDRMPWSKWGNKTKVPKPKK